MVIELELFSVLSVVVIALLAYGILVAILRQRNAETDSERSNRCAALNDLRFRYVYERNPEPMVILSPDGRILKVNDAWHELTGVTKKEFPNFIKTYNAFEDESSPSIELARLVRSVFTEGVDVISMPFQFKWAPAGREFVSADRWVCLDFRPIHGPKGEIAEVLICIMDVTEQRKANLQAERMEGMLSALIDNSESIIFVKDLDGRYELVNAKWSRTFGVPSFYAVGKTTAEIFPEQTANEFRKNDLRVVDAGTALQNEEIVITADGSTRSYLTVKFPIHDPEGKLKYVAGIATDITDRKQHESERAELLVREQSAIEASLMKSAFLANMSHELRTPIHGIMGMADLLISTELGEQQKTYNDAIMQSADSLLTLVNDILDLSKAEAGKIEIESVDVNPRKIVEDVERTLRMASWKKGINLKISVEDKVPPCVIGDPTRIRQILMNLVSNAIKFTDSGEVVVQASLQGEHQLRFDVLDTGIGITEETMPRLFSAFSQADASTTRRFGGTGLGLSISKHLVLLMEGEIGVAARETRGTRFWFNLPLRVKAVAPVLARPVEDELNMPQKALRILVAEDNTTNQMIVTAALRNLGHTPVVANNGAEALHALEIGPFDLILMDCQMPVMDGYEATRQIRGNQASPAAKIPIIALTANAMRDDMEKCMAAGMSDYIAKPAKTQDIRNAIRRVMDDGAKMSA